ncbi:MAG: iron ABC transporter substrate-binding protein [Desulfuromonadaceae bacterium]
MKTYFMKRLRRTILGLVLIMVPSAAFGNTQGQRTIVDMLGRKVSIPQKINRIVPLAGAMRYVVYLHAVDKVVGVEAIETNRAVTTGRPYNLAIRKKAAKLPIVGEGMFKPVNAEAVIAAKPDLIIIAARDAETANNVAQKTGLPVLALAGFGGKGVFEMDSTIKSLEMLGSAIGKEQRSREVVQFIKNAEKDLDRRTGKPAKGGPKVYVGCLGANGAHGITSTDADYFPLDAAHGTNVAKSLGKRGHLYIDKEQLLVWNPAIILIDSGGLTLFKEDYIRNRTFYDTLDAVKKGRVYVTPPYNYYSTNIEIALANAYFAGSVMYPGKFSDVNIAKKADDIFRFFTGIPCYEKMQKEFGGYQNLHFSNGVIHAR